MRKPDFAGIAWRAVVAALVSHGGLACSSAGLSPQTLVMAGRDVSPMRVAVDGPRATVSTPDLQVSVDQSVDGGMAVGWTNGVAIRGIGVAAELIDTAGKPTPFAGGPQEWVGSESVIDEFGPGVRLTTRSRSVDGTELRRHVWVYAAVRSVFTQVELVAPPGRSVATRRLEPIVTHGPGNQGGITLGTSRRPLNLFVLYDNDAYSRYRAEPGAVGSREIAAVFDTDSRRGLVVGTVTHDLWKTGVVLGPAEAEDGPTQLRVTAGSTDRKTTFDTQPHGIVRGALVSSPRVFVGAFDDWRDGMEAFGHTNAVLRPALPWAGGKPVGWNSWAAHKEQVSGPYVEAAIDLVSELKDRGFSAGGAAYVNLDSYWDNLSDTALAELSRKARERGPRFGLYFAPFCGWDGDLDHVVPGTGERYRYRDIVLKSADGKPLPKHDGAWPLDPTHPGTRMRNDAVFARFARIGVDFVKLDFLTHGALEGEHYDPNVPTGTAAYNAGMRDVLAALSLEKMGRPVFVSLSIAPLFPHGYGHARRTSCDAFGTIGSTEYLLNSQTFGWWTHNTLYRFNDPDHSVVYQTAGERALTEAEARTRLNASLISGGLILASDDATNPAARKRMADLLPSVAARTMLPSEVCFRPVDVPASSGAATAFVAQAAGRTFVAAFNVSPDRAFNCCVPLDRAGDAHATRAVDLETGRLVGSIDAGVLRLDLPARSSVLLRLEP